MESKIIIIGNEILDGFTKEKNSFFLINELSKIGINISQVVFIKDNILAIQNELIVSNNIELILLSGGLGPTSDDLTSESLYKYFKKPPSSLIKNTLGTAPGIQYVKNGICIIALPGVPRELKNMFTNELLPEFVSMKKRKLIHFFQINTIGISESQLAQTLKEFECTKPSDMSISYLPENAVVKLRFYSKSNNYKPAFQQIKIDLKKILGNAIFGYGDISFESFLIELLIKHRITISVAESCTGGYISRLMTSCSGASTVFKGGITAYSNDSKVNLLKIDEHLINKKSAVSQEVAMEMANAVRKKFKSDYGISSTGFIGPNGPKKLIGVVWLACSSKKNTVSKMLKLNLNRPVNMMLASRLALNLLREQII